MILVHIRFGTMKNKVSKVNYWIHCISNRNVGKEDLSLKTLSKKMISFILTFVMLFGFSISVFAGETIDEQYTPVTTEMVNAFSEMSNIAAKCVDVTDTHEINSYAHSVSILVSDDNFVVNAGKHNLDFNKVHVIKANFDGKNYIMVNIAIKGKYSTLSNLNLIFDDADHLIYYSETLLENNVQTNKFVVSSYQNGVLIERKQTDIDFITNDQIEKGIEGLKNISHTEHKISARSVGGKVACLAGVLGVNGVVAKLVAATCVAACTAEPVGGAVCAACVGGVCAIGAADVGAIVECFKL